MIKGVKRVCYLLAVMVMATSVSACVVFPSQPSGGNLSKPEKQSSLPISGEESVGGSSSTLSSSETASNASDESSSSEDKDSSDVQLPPTQDPDPQKELLKTQVDALGHEIAYYTDGSWEDLGRVTPLDLTPKAPTEKLGYQSLAKEENSQELRAFYMDIYGLAMEFFSSTEDIAKGNGEYYALEILNVESYGLTMDELKSVWGTMKQDYPEFYWISNEMYTRGSDNAIYEFLLCIDQEYASGTARARVQENIRKSVLECDAYVNGVMSEAERALVIHDYLAADIAYAYEADGITPADETWAHNIVGWAEYNLGVCETYAETFAYLCELFGIESSVVVGVAGEGNIMGGHAWNILNLENEWYTVDVTWDDGFAGEFISRQYFGMPASEFALSHIANTAESVWGGDYQFALPTLSENGLSPVIWSVNGGQKTWCVSMDKALEEMTDEGGKYEITLYPTSQILTDRGLVVYPSGGRFSAPMPKVETLRIQGKFIYTDKTLGWGYMPDLTYRGDLVLNGTLVLDCVALQVSSILENGYAVECKNNAEVNGNIV